MASVSFLDLFAKRMAKASTGDVEGWEGIRAAMDAWTYDEICAEVGKYFFDSKPDVAFDWVEESAKHEGLRCTICFDIADEPYEAICCSQVVCAECKKRAEANDRAACPCRDNAKGYRECKPLRRIIADLDVRCHGCGEILKRDRFSAHVDEDCPVACPLIKCPSTEFCQSEFCPPEFKNVNQAHRCPWVGPVAEFCDHLANGCLSKCSLATATVRAENQWRALLRQRGHTGQRTEQIAGGSSRGPGVKFAVRDDDLALMNSQLKNIAGALSGLLAGGACVDPSVVYAVLSSLDIWFFRGRDVVVSKNAPQRSELGPLGFLLRKETGLEPPGWYSDILEKLHKVVMLRTFDYWNLAFEAPLRLAQEIAGLDVPSTKVLSRPALIFHAFGALEFPIISSNDIASVDEVLPREELSRPASRLSTNMLYNITTLKMTPSVFEVQEQMGFGAARPPPGTKKSLADQIRYKLENIIHTIGTQSSESQSLESFKNALATRLSSQLTPAEIRFLQDDKQWCVSKKNFFHVEEDAATAEDRQGLRALWFAGERVAPATLDGASFGRGGASSVKRDGLGGVPPAKRRRMSEDDDDR